MTDRREFLLQTGKLLLLTGAAGLAYDHVLAGSRRAPPGTTKPGTGGGC